MHAHDKQINQKVFKNHKKYQIAHPKNVSRW